MRRQELCAARRSQCQCPGSPGNASITSLGSLCVSIWRPAPLACRRRVSLLGLHNPSRPRAENRNPAVPNSAPSCANLPCLSPHHPTCADRRRCLGAGGVTVKKFDASARRARRARAVSPRFVAHASACSRCLGRASQHAARCRRRRRRRARLAADWRLTHAKQLLPAHLIF